MGEIEVERESVRKRERKRKRVRHRSLFKHYYGFERKKNYFIHIKVKD